MAAEPKPLIVIVGPTASGKSALGITLAKKCGGEIICADSRTVYKYMDIGTAKPNKKDRKDVPHHLLDVVEPDQSFTAADFKALANQTIDAIHQKGKVPIMVGGSGLYIDALLFDYSFAAVDADRDEQNPRHRAAHVAKSKKELRNNTLVIGIRVEPQELKRRITSRIDEMVQHGLVEEVYFVMEQYPHSKALLAPGYKALVMYIEGHIKLEEAKELFARNDYQLARRQMTWFKRNKSIHWVTDQSEAVDLATTFLYKSP